MTGKTEPTAEHAHPYPAPRWALSVSRFTAYATGSFGGGPRLLKFSWIINFQKCGTFFFLGFLMWYYQNYATSVWVYLALQGSYGLCWFIKDTAFPDTAWQQRITFGGAINTFLGVLGWYWLFGWLLISRTSTPEYPLPDGAWYALCISMCIVGSAIMIASDAQKFFTLRIKRALIIDGMHRYIRHPNYLGEMLIYLSFALMVWHWLPFLVLAWVWVGLFAVNMLIKEASMSRYPQWQHYKQNTWWLLPGIL